MLLNIGVRIISGYSETQHQRWIISAGNPCRAIRSIEDNVKLPGEISLIFLKRIHPL